MARLNDMQSTTPGLIASATLTENQVPAPVLAVAQQLVSARMAAGAGEEDYSGMAKTILHLAGIRD